MARAKILHLHNIFDPGDKEDRAVRLMNHFGDMAEHTVISADPRALGARDAIDRGIRVEFPGEAAPLLAGRPGIRRYQDLARYMKKFSLILTYGWGAIDGVMAHTLFGKRANLRPLIHHEDGFDEDETDQLMARRNWFRIIALQRSHSLVVPSKTLEKIAGEVWHQPVDKICRFPNAVNVAQFAKKPQRGSFPGFKRREGEIIIGTIAELRGAKNLTRLVRAAAAAGSNIRLAIAGDGPERGAILAEATRLGMADRIMMPGFLKDPHRYAGLFDIFALSSDSEQYPVSLIQGMAAGCPVVATDVGDVYNMVAAPNREFIIPREDEDGLAKAISALSNNAELRSKLGEANYRRAYAEYGEAIMFARYRQLYGSAMGRADFARQA